VSSKKEAEFELNQDFFSKRMPPQELTALVAALQAGVIPLDDVLWNLEQGEMLDPSRTLEEARELLDMDAARNAELHPDPVLVSMETKQAELDAAAKAKPAATAGKPTMKTANPGTPVAKPKARTT
jgi:exonuclease VII small subunit